MLHSQDVKLQKSEESSTGNSMEVVNLDKR